MEEFDLRDIWQQADQSAGAFFEDIAPELEQRARKRSKSTIDKVLRNVKIEMWFTVIFGIGVLFLPDLTDTLFWGLIVANLIAIPMSIRLYKQIYDRIRAVNQSSVKAALEEKISILRNFVKRLEWLTYFILPIGFCIGIGISIIDSGDHLFSLESLKALLISTLIAAPILLLFIWFFKKKYIYWLYGQHLEELEELYEGLDQ